MRRRDKPLDIYKKLQIVRAIEDLVFEDEGNGTNEKSYEPENFKTTTMKKKKLNIPVGDVKIDPSYDQNVSPDFIIPQSYVRYTKKIGDEEDSTIDYCLEQDDFEWLEKHSKLNFDLKLTGELLEKIFNTLERNTGTGDPLDMITAEKIISQMLVWKTKPASLNSIFPEIYQRWIYKRNFLHRPLCRRYWPQTNPADTNPHNVFRPREKERYRLRKHRKNDLHSFRKLQSLRRELGKARIILQLVVERELIKQAQLELQSNILDCRLKLLQCEDDTESDNDEEKENIDGEDNDKDEGYDKEDFLSKVRYKPRFEHLIPVRDSESSSVHFNEEKEKDSTGLRLTLNMKSHTLSSDSIKKQSGRPRKRESGNELISDGVIPLPPTTTTTTTVRQRNRSSNSTASVWKGEIPGLPPSPWPSFMEPLDTRQQIFIAKDMSEYMRELELKPDETPYKYRCRGRIGRGGRVVMDRIPVYRSDPDPYVHQSYHLPTQLSSLQSQLAYQKAAEFLSLSNSSSNSISNSSDNLILSLRSHESNCISNLPLTQLEEIQCYHSSLSNIQSYPLFYPPERSAISCIVTSEEREIYINSDSEDEVVEIRHLDEPYPPTNKILDPSAVKYSFIDI